MLQNLFLIILFIIINSCSVFDFLKDDELTIKRTNFSGSQLKTNGYYMHIYGNPENITIYFLNRDGVFIYAGSPPLKDLGVLEQEFIDGTFNNYIKKYKTSWGVFAIEDKSIKIERWYPSEPPLNAYIEEGEILNDTTFIIKEIYRQKNNKKKETKTRNETYHFKAFSPKPDSANNFVK